MTISTYVSSSKTGKEVIFKDELPTVAAIVEAAKREFPHAAKDQLEIAFNDYMAQPLFILRKKRL